MLVYYFTKAEHALENIRYRRLKISNLMDEPSALGPLCGKL
jgi:hypothetical protein